MMRNALRWGDGNASVRLGVTAITQQHIADELEAVLLTPRLCDVMALHALAAGGLVRPNTQPITKATQAYVHHSDKIDAALPVGYDGIVAGWKDWCVSADMWRGRRGPVTNYGWHMPATTKYAPAPLRPSFSEKSLKVIQQASEAHNGYHADYSRRRACPRPGHQRQRPARHAPWRAQRRCGDLAGLPERQGCRPQTEGGQRSRRAHGVRHKGLDEVERDHQPS
jgi:hypothetical protein